jgi:hypothetical protein
MLFTKKDILKSDEGEQNTFYGLQRAIGWCKMAP